MVYIYTYCNFTDTILIFSHISTGTYAKVFKLHFQNSLKQSQVWLINILYNSIILYNYAYI